MQFSMPNGCSGTKIPKTCQGRAWVFLGFFFFEKRGTVNCGTGASRFIQKLILRKIHLNQLNLALGREISIVDIYEFARDFELSRILDFAYSNKAGPTCVGARGFESARGGHEYTVVGCVR